MKKLLFCMIFAAQITYAETAKLLIVETVDGEKFSFALSANPQITFRNQTMYLNTDSQSQDFEIANVAQYFFESTANGIRKLQADELRVSKIDNDRILVEGIGSPSDLKLYAANGVQMPTNLSYSEGKVVISLSSMPKGVYIITANKKQNIKFYKK